MTLLTVQEACATLGVGMTTFYALLNAGQVKVVRIGRRTMVSDRELDRFIKQGEGSWKNWRRGRGASGLRGGKTARSASACARGPSLPITGHLSRGKSAGLVAQSS